MKRREFLGFSVAGACALCAETLGASEILLDEISDEISPNFASEILEFCPKNTVPNFSGLFCSPRKSPFLIQTFAAKFQIAKRKF